MIYYDLVLPAFEGTPKNVRLWGMLAPRVEKAVVLRKLYLLVLSMLSPVLNT